MNPGGRPPRRALDLRLLPLAGGLWLGQGPVLARAGASGGISAGSVAVGVVGLAVGALLAIILIRADARPTRHVAVWRGPVALALAGIAVGAVTASLQLGGRDPWPVPDLAAHQARVAGEFVATSRLTTMAAPGRLGPEAPARRRWSVRADSVWIAEGDRRWDVQAPVVVSGWVLPNDPVPSLLPGSRFVTDGALKRGNPGRREGVLISAWRLPEVVGPAPPWQRLAEEVRGSLRRSDAGLAPGRRGLIEGLAVGEEARIPTELRSDMREVGMSHLTAVSGANLAIVAGVVILLLRGLGLRRATVLSAASLAVAAYVVVVGFEPSVIRAAVMVGVALIAAGRGRRGGAAAAAGLSFTVCLLLLIDPWLSVSWAFALSVAATAALVLRVHVHQRRQALRGLAPRFVRAGREALGVAAWCTVATAPLVVAMTGRAPLVGIAANAVSAPAVPVVTVLGMAAASVGTMSPALASALAWVAQFPAAWIEAVATQASAVGARLPEFLSAPATVVAGVGLGLAAWVAFRFRLEGAGTRRFRVPRSWPALGLGAGVATLLLAWTGRGLGPGGWPPPDWVAVFCDVGQGDTAVVATSPGHAIVVDAGPDPRKADRCLGELGVTTVDLLLITHFHADHVEGLSGVLSGRSVGRVLASDLREPAAEATWVSRALDDVGAPSPAVAPLGESARLGMAEYEVLWSTSAHAAARFDGSAPNNASVGLVVHVRAVDIMLLGDLEPAAQQALIDSRPGGQVDVIKIPHHGSRHQDADLVPWSQARVAVASAGAGNGYGHPAPATLAAWRASGARVFRTDEDSDVAILAGEDGSPGVAVRRPSS